MTDEELLVARLTGGVITIPTGTDRPKNIKFDLGATLVKTEGKCPDTFSHNRYKKQFTELNEFLRTNHQVVFEYMNIKPCGRQFIAISGDLTKPPVMVWRRSGVGMGAASVVFYKGRSWTVGELLGEIGTELL